jgi:hypothetical protein
MSDPGRHGDPSKQAESADVDRVPSGASLVARIGWGFGLGILGFFSGAIVGCVQTHKHGANAVEIAGPVIGGTAILGATIGTCLGFFLIAPFIAAGEPAPTDDESRNDRE